jgi:hypothetical protein
LSTEINESRKLESIKSSTIFKLIKSPIKIKQATNPLGEMSVLEERVFTSSDIF